MVCCAAAVRDELGAGALQLLGGRRVLAAARVARRAHAARVARRARRRPLLAPLRSRALRSAPFRSQLFGSLSPRLASLLLPRASRPIPSHPMTHRHTFAEGVSRKYCISLFAALASGLS